MAKRNKVSADNAALRKANMAAVKGFKKTAIIAALNKLAESKGTAEAAKDSGSGASLDLCKLASAFVTANEGRDSTTLTSGWRDNMALIRAELATVGHPFVKVTEAKDDKPARFSWTGTGSNVLSIAKGVVEFSVDVSKDCVNESGEVSYREVRAHVQGLREAARRATDPEGAALSDAKAMLSEAMSDYRSLVTDTGDVGLILAVVDQITAARADFEAGLKAQAELDERADDEDDEAEQQVANG